MNYAFVMGIARSGTTAFTRVLNAHSKILIGVERFKLLALRQSTGDQFGPELFDRDRLFDVRPTDTNVPQDFLLREANNYEKKIWLGDKIPHLFKRNDVVFRRFPDARVFCMLRDGVDVALSWDARANRSRDKWPEGNGFLAGIDRWNRANAKLWALHKKLPGRISFVRYESFFGGDGGSLKKVLRLLDLAPEPEVLDYFHRQLDRHFELEALRLRPDELVKEGRAQLDLRTYDRLCSLSVV
jgi:Sulfotransferase family